MGSEDVLLAGGADGLPGGRVKKTKASEATYTCWFASWREGGKVKNVHLGSTKNMDEAAAMAKARKPKAEALDMEE